MAEKAHNLSMTSSSASSSPPTESAPSSQSQQHPPQEEQDITSQNISPFLRSQENLITNNSDHIANFTLKRNSWGSGSDIFGMFATDDAEKAALMKSTSAPTLPAVAAAAAAASGINTNQIIKNRR